MRQQQPGVKWCQHFTELSSLKCRQGEKARNGEKAKEQYLENEGEREKERAKVARNNCLFSETHKPSGVAGHNHRQRFKGTPSCVRLGVPCLPFETRPAKVWCHSQTDSVIPVMSVPPSASESNQTEPWSPLPEKRQGFHKTNACFPSAVLKALMNRPVSWSASFFSVPLFLRYVSFSVLCWLSSGVYIICAVRDCITRKH